MLYILRFIYLLYTILYTGDNMGSVHVVEDIVLTQMLNNKVFQITENGVTVRYRFKDGVKLVIEVQKGFEPLFRKSYTLHELNIDTLRKLFDKASIFRDKVLEVYEFFQELKKNGWTILEEGEKNGI